MKQLRHLYEFAPFRLEPAERRLLRDGNPVAITPKCFDLLIVLVQNAGSLVEKADLLAQVWPKQVVEEGNLSFTVSELRKVLGDGREGRRYIETVRSKGFRFVAPVGVVADDATAAEAMPQGRRLRRWPAFVALAMVLGVAAVVLRGWSSSRTPVEHSPRTIAVLPFKPLGETVRDEPLEMGVCNAIIVRLSSLPQLVVRPTSAVVGYDKIGQDALSAGRQLGVDALLEGYIQRSEGKVRVTAQLLRTTDGKPLWSGQFNDSFTDIFAVEDSISRQIADALQLNLSGEERRQVARHDTENVEAYDLYLKGRFFQERRTTEATNKSIEYFQRSVEKDPRYALAFAGLAESYINSAIRADRPPRDAHQKAKAAALRAIEIDDANAEAHAVLANVRFWYEWDWPGAQAEFKRALELRGDEPLINNNYAIYLLTMGHREEAIAEIRHARRLAPPLSLSANVLVARILYFARRYDEGIAECRKSIDLDPNFGGAHLFLGRIYEQKGMYAQGLVEMKRARELMGDSAEIAALIGYAEAASGRRAEAKKALDELQALAKQRYVSPYHMAMIYAGLDEKDAAFACLERAYVDREGRMTLLKWAPEFDHLRADPRLAKLLGRMNLT